MKPSTTTAAMGPLAATTRVADARAALQRARAGQQKATARTKDTAAEIAGLEARLKETAKALETARASQKVNASQGEAWEAVAEFAAADLTLAETELTLTEVKDRLARHDADHAGGGDTPERTALAEAVRSAAARVESVKTETRHAKKRSLAEKAEGWLDEVRKAEAGQRRLAVIDRQLAQLRAVSARKDAERKTWGAREKKTGEDLAKLDQERKTLEAERRRLAGT
jgi:chromosome segregation ATPase